MFLRQGGKYLANFDCDIWMSLARIAQTIQRGTCRHEWLSLDVHQVILLSSVCLPVIGDLVFENT